jgi:hypothetical protein
MAGTKNYTSGNPSNTPSVTVSSAPITHVEPYTGRLYEEEPTTSSSANAASSGDATYVTGNACQDCLNNINVGVAGAGESIFARRESNTFLFKGIKSEGAITVRTAGGSLIIGGSGALPALEEILATQGSFTDEQKGKVLVINSTGDGLDFVDLPTGGSQGSSRFADLVDIPLMAGQGGKVLTVNVSGTGVEWKLPQVPVLETVVFNDKTPKLARYLDLNGNALASMATGYTTNIGYGDSVVQAALPVGATTKLNITADRLELVGKGISFNAGSVPQFFPATAPTVGQVLGYAGNTNALYGGGAQLEWITPSAGGSTVTKFTALDDTPSSYVGMGGRYVRVKTDLTGVEFVTPSVDWTNVNNKPTLFDGAYGSLTGKPTIPTKLVDLSDVPGVAGNAGKVLGLNSSGVVAWISAGGVTTFGALTDIPSISGNAGKVLSVNTSATGYQWSTPPGSRFTALADAPATYTGKAGQVVRVNSVENAVEFAVPTVEWTNVGSKPSFVTTLVQLSDLPATAGNAGKVLGLKASGTGFQWYTLPTSGGTGSATFNGLSDVPATYSGAGRALRINTTNDGLEYFDLAAVATAGTFASLTGKPTKISDFDVPTYQNGKVLGVASGVLSWVSLPAAGATALTGLSDVSLSSPTNGQVLTYNSSTSKWIASTVTSSGGATSLATLSDVTISGTPANNSILKYDTTSGKWIVGTQSAGGSSTFVALTDGPGAFTGKAGQSVRVNTGATALEYYTPATGASTLATLTDVNTAGAVANSIIKYDTTTSKWVIGVLPAAGATTLAALTDVTTSGAATGSILSFNSGTGKWTAGAHTHNLSTLSDVNTSGIAAGSILKWDTTSSKWIIGSAGASALTGLSDVTVTSPATGQVLTYNGTKWVNQTPAASTGGGTTTGGVTTYRFDVTFTDGSTSGLSKIASVVAPSGWTATPDGTGNTFAVVKNVSGNPSNLTVWGLQSSTNVGRYKLFPAVGTTTYILADLDANTFNVVLNNASTYGAATTGGKAIVYVTI